MSQQKSRPKLGMNRGVAPDLSIVRAAAMSRTEPADAAATVTAAPQPAIEEQIHSLAPTEVRPDPLFRQDTAPVASPQAGPGRAQVAQPGPQHATLPMISPPVAAEPARAPEILAPPPVVASVEAAPPLQGKVEPSAAAAQPMAQPVYAEPSPAPSVEIAPPPSVLPAAPSAESVTVAPSIPQPVVARASTQSSMRPTATRRAPATPVVAVERAPDPVGAKRIHGTFTEPRRRVRDQVDTRQTTVTHPLDLDERIDALIRNNRGAFPKRSSAWVAAMEILLEQYGE